MRKRGKRGIRGTEEKEVPVNSRSCRSSFGLSIANHAGYDEVWVVHDGAERDGQGITQLATFVDGTRCFRVDVA